MLDPAGPSAAAIAAVWWWMFGVAVVVSVGVVAAWLIAMRRQQPLDGEAARRIGQRWIIGGGVLLPSVAVLALLIGGASAGRHQRPWAGPGDGPEPLRIEVTARQWRWELRYPQRDVTLLNELRLPAGRPVELHTRSLDVIHSFWVPRLGGKIDALPGRTLVVRLQADAPGTMRGQCAEFCGIGHAHMPIEVVAMPPADFDAWLAGVPPDAVPAR